MSQGPLCPNLTKKVQKEVSEMANCKLSCAMLYRWFKCKLKPPKKPYLEQNISYPKLDGSDKKANTNTSPEMKISCNVKQGTSLVKNSSQTVEIKDKTNQKNSPIRG